MKNKMDLVTDESSSSKSTLSPSGSEGDTYIFSLMIIRPPSLSKVGCRSAPSPSFWLRTESFPEGERLGGRSAALHFCRNCTSSSSVRWPNVLHARTKKGRQDVGDRKEIEVAAVLMG